MVHSVYGWEDRSHTSPKVGYSHPSKKRKNKKRKETSSRLARESLIWEQWRKYLRGPAAAGQQTGEGEPR